MAENLFDTTVPISYTRRRPGVIELVEGLLDEDHQVGICAIGIAEFYTNVRPHEAELAERLTRLSAFSSGVGEGIYEPVVQSDGEFLRVGVSDRQ